MANNCLVTKLKSVVQNDNLPELNTIILKFKTPIDTTLYRVITIGATQNYKVYIDSNAPMHIGTIGTTGVTHYDVPIVPGVGYSYAAVFFEEDTDYTIKITGDIYNSLKLLCFANGLGGQYCPVTVLGESANYIHAMAIDYLLGSNNPYADLVSINNNTPVEDLENNIVYVKAQDLADIKFNARLVVTEGSINNTSILGCNFVSGLLVDTPKNMKYIVTHSPTAQTVENFVASRRNAGVMSGHCEIHGTTVKNGLLTYNGSPVPKLDGTTSTCIIEWTADSISFETTSRPSDIEKIKNKITYYIV